MKHKKGIYGVHYREPVWPNGKGLGWISGRTSVGYRFGSPFSSKRLWFVDSLMTLSITSYRNIKMTLIAAHLNAEVILVVTV